MTVSEEYEQAKMLAREIAETFASPRFYADFGHEREVSDRMLYTDPVLEQLRSIVQARDEHFGHGLRHSEKVAADAGVIVQVESARIGASPERTGRVMFLVQSASLLHDVKRRVADHARKSASAAAEILADFPLDTCERDWIVRSIRNHEAFTEPIPLESDEAQLLSDALYDADKFRWGPDNFTETLWDMVSPEKICLQVLLAHFPKGMEGVNRIATTFRSPTGQEYGPEFIEIGLAIGNKLYRELLKIIPPERD
jgi:hypothetical protein